MTGSEILAGLATAAAFERDERARLYPQLVHQKKITMRATEEDQRAWTAIAEWLETGAVRWGTGQGRVWTPLRDAAAEALSRRENACRRAPADAALASRRDNVAAIHAMLDRLADAFESARAVEAA